MQIELVASDQISNLLRREADIAVRMVRPDQSSLIARKIGSLSLGLYASNDYLKRFGTPVRASDFDKHRLIGYDTSDIIIRSFCETSVRFVRGLPARMHTHKRLVLIHSKGLPRTTDRPAIHEPDPLVP